MPDHDEPYREWPSPLRRDAFACVWIGGAGPTTVRPDACIDLVWDGEALVVAGPDTAPFTTATAPGGYVAGARFRPGRAPAFLGLPACELLDRRVGLEVLWGARAVERIVAALRAAPSPAEAAEALAVAAMSLPGAGDAVVDPVVDALVGWLAAAPPSAGAVAAASDALGVGERTLHRRCTAAVGYGPKMLERVLRFRRAERLGLLGGPIGLVAARAGYADQAHLVREFHRLAGATPSEMFKTGRGVAS